MDSQQEHNTNKTSVQYFDPTKLLREGNVRPHTKSKKIYKCTYCGLCKKIRWGGDGGGCAPVTVEVVVED